MREGFLRRCATGLVALATAIGLAACGGGDDTPTTPTAGNTGSVAGRVVASSDSQPVAGATVTLGAAMTQTAADGSYTLNAVPASDHAVLRVHAEGFVDALVTTPVTQGATRRTNARLLREAAAVTFDAANAGVVVATGSSARVDLPAGSLVVAATGAAASGNVKASVTPIDPGADPRTMPGDYTVADGTRIESFGAIKVKLQDAAGNALQLKTGSRATIRIPVASRSAQPPQTIPLYYFDEATGRWVQEGSATLKGSGADAHYEGEVSHFTIWNADKPQETIYVNGCVATPAGQRVPDVLVTAQGIDYSGMATDSTDEQGRFRVAIRKGGRASLWAELDRSSNTVVVGPSETDITLTECLVLDTTPVAPTIVEPPVAVNATIGSPASFKVVASGTQLLRYQWQRDGVNIPGAVYDMFWLPAVSAADAGTYRVIVTNDVGSVTSAGAVLTATAPVAPTVVSQPVSTTVASGEMAQFSVTVNGSDPLRFQWQRNGVDIPGAVLNVLMLPSVAVGDAGTYRVIVTNAAGSVTSTGAVLTVTAPVAPTIAAQPMSTTVTAGDPATFVALAEGSGPLSYQWLRDGAAISGATGAVYTIPATALADNGAHFQVRVSNAVGSVLSAQATLTVKPLVVAAPQITSQPADTSAAAGNTALFVVLATGTPAPTYQWYRNGSAIAGATGATYTTPTLVAGDNGATFSVVVTNSQGSVTSRNATLTVTNDGSTEQKMQLMRLLSLSFDFYEAASLPMQLVDDDAGTLVSPATVCSPGSISGSFNGGALPAPGTALPTSGTLAATASGCATKDGTLVSGTSSVNYNFSAFEPPSGSATATVTNVHLRSPATGTATLDITANGTATATTNSSLANGQLTTTTSLAPAGGATLRSELSGLTAAFASGDVSLLLTTVDGSTLPVRTRVSYNNLRFAVGSVNYLANGSYEVTYSTPGAFAGASGEVLLTTGGTTVGRIYGNAQGIFIEVNGTVQPFKAPRGRLSR